MSVSEFFEDIKINVPSCLEQTKIATFLNLIDLLIEKIRNEKSLLQQYKKGVIQKIFTQEIRFTDGANRKFPEWEEKPLKSILKERKTFSIKGNGYPHISLTTRGVVPKSERYDRDFLVGDDKIKKYKITHLNDLCYNPANLKFGVIALNKLGDGIFSPIYVTFEIIGQNIDFIGYYLTRSEFINKARRYEQGTVYERMAVSPSDFLKVEVKIPSLPEQEKIANYLKSLDRLIEIKEKQLVQAEQWKKGLMQKLFI
jgi:type I restriction enzyme S subunit